ncbi:ATP-binding protein [Spirillospora sp. NPDC127200]
MRPRPVEDVVSRMIAKERAEVRRCRDFVAEWCEERGFHQNTADDARTIVSELVTNALTHTRGGGLLRLYLSDAGPVVEVWDLSTTLPNIRPLDLTGEEGRGLAIVARLSASWGCNPLASGGKCVWAVLDSD